MNAFLLVLPIVIIRYGLLGAVNKEGLKRANFFPEVIEGERIAFWAYQILNTFILLYLLFLKIRLDRSSFYIGLLIYVLGAVFYSISVVDFARPSAEGFNSDGVYRISRNPMYVAYFLYFLGCVLLTRSLLLLIVLLVFQAAVHWIIISEERWCINNFGDKYLNYMKRVRRYF